jgi:hypothetical protein
MPIRMAEAMPPAHASTGITTAQLFELACTAVAAAPASTPTPTPLTATEVSRQTAVDTVAAHGSIRFPTPDQRARVEPRAVRGLV